jgi:DNA-binding FadR family transcriptional regulator
LLPGMPGSFNVVSQNVAQRSRAGQIVQRLTSTYSAEEWARGTRLGSQEDLCGRHSADREVFRQAVRILESFGAAKTDCGRGNGLSSQRPNSSAASRLIACYFASRQLGLDEANFLLQMLSQEAAALAAQRASEQDDVSIENSLANLMAALNGENQDAVPVALYRSEQSLFAPIANPVLDVILQAARSYPSCWLHSPMGSKAAITRRFLELSRAVQSAVRARDPRAAWQAQGRKAHVLNHLFLSGSRSAKPVASLDA